MVPFAGSTCSPDTGAAAARTRAAPGISLIELLVAIAVLGILAGLGVSGFSSVAGKARVIGATTDLLNAVQLARSEAMKRGRRVTLLPAGGDWASGWQVFVDTNGNRALDAGEPLIQRHARFNPATRVTVDTTPGYIAFGANGLPQQYSGAFLAATITLCDTGSARSLVVAKSGRPRITPQAC